MEAVILGVIAVAFRKRELCIGVQMEGCHEGSSG
jgi:hypothetical protein